MAKYLSGSTHYLTEKEAYERYSNSEMHEIRAEEDGTYSVFHFSLKPVQAGQMEWKTN